MATKKKVAEKTINTPVAEKKDKGVAVVTWPGSADRPAGTREYSKEVHGADYKKLAEEFAGKAGGSVA